jgi:hypothetical protein
LCHFNIFNAQCKIVLEMHLLFLLSSRRNEANALDMNAFIIFTLRDGHLRVKRAYVLLRIVRCCIVVWKRREGYGLTAARLAARCIHIAYRFPSRR